MISLADLNATQREAVFPEILFMSTSTHTKTLKQKISKQKCSALSVYGHCATKELDIIIAC